MNDGDGRAACRGAGIGSSASARTVGLAASRRSSGCPLAALRTALRHAWFVGNILAGSATLKFFDVANEELMPIAPREVLGGYSLPMANVLEGIRVVHDYNA